MASLYNKYIWMFTENADHRVQSWFMMSGPLPLLSVILFYLWAVKVALPAYMSKREAYDLTRIIKLYNILLIIANATVFWGILTSGWTSNYHMGCLKPDYSDDPAATRMLRFFWWTFIIKLAELVETSFFFFRKRYHQASILHIYHHVVSLCIIWLATKYVGGGMTSLTPLVNTFVHVVMYCYYLATLIGGRRIRSHLNKWKKWLTLLQMAQFTVILVHGMQVYLPTCNAPTGITYFFFPNVLMIYYLFYDFYKNTYSGMKSS